jgi:hypothetical protein
LLQVVVLVAVRQRQAAEEPVDIEQPLVFLQQPELITRLLLVLVALEIQTITYKAQTAQIQYLAQ